ncbi:rod shape-determining protein MreD [uncultured Flavobacterium sp.]|uniref:rod shape-determining protein MreD n=1 Tax=uncultured Flavobacterium sp. TaxID=165435 RepID=UPI0030CA40AF|tara:strand:- start:1110 stop:1616 length:507 start_codon:yes stop_codon:yes gene_type:complete
MNSNFLINLLRFVILISFQVLVFNNIKLFGYIDPFPYVLFIILYPANSNKSILLLSSFFLGITLDLFSDTGGIHATACLILAFIRPYIFKFAFGLSYEYQTIKISEKVSSERIVFVFIAVFIHHFIIYTLELFRFGLSIDILVRPLLNAVFTSIICILSLYLIKPSRQ